jgi:pimeloyl-ACP methyl ester carboxylesterase
MNALGGLVTVLLLVLLGLWYFTRRMASLVETRIPPLGRFADVAGARLHYVDRGEAKDQLPIVMLHGLGGQLHHFNYGLVEALAGDTRVIAIDRPGSGYSERIADQATTLFEQAAAIDALLTQLGIGRTLLVGHSLGGALSLTMALQYPQRIAGVALIAPLTRGTTPRSSAR